MKFTAILRGINVGGKRKILMTDLKKLFHSFGYQNCVTYIQSGNVLFESSEKNDTLHIGKAIEKAIREKYGFDVPVIIRTSEEIVRLYENNPFLKKENNSIEKLHVVFLEEIPSTENLRKIEKFSVSPDKFKIVNNHIYIYCDGKYSSSKLTNQFFEKKLKIKATTRNWKTTSKLYKLAS